MVPHNVGGELAGCELVAPGAITKVSAVQVPVAATGWASSKSVKSSLIAQISEMKKYYE